MASNDIYLEATEKLVHPGLASFVKYLRVLFTSEEGELHLRFLEPATREQVADAFNVRTGTVRRSTSRNDLRGASTRRKSPAYPS